MAGQKEKSGQSGSGGVVCISWVSSKFPEAFAMLRAENPNHFASPERLQSNLKKLAGLRTDGDFPIVWATTYGMGRVWYSTSGHLEATLDDMHIQQMVQQKRRSQSSHEHARV
jgi:hypothetical protein